MIYGLKAASDNSRDRAKLLVPIFCGFIVPLALVVAMIFTSSAAGKETA